MDPDLNTKLCTHNPKRSLSSANRMPHPTDTSLTHSINQSINQPTNPSIYPSICLSTDLYIYICMYVYVYIYIYGSGVKSSTPEPYYIYICMCVYIYIQSLSPCLSVSFYPCCCKSLSHGRAAGDFFGTEILHLKRQTPSHKARKQLIGSSYSPGMPVYLQPAESIVCNSSQSATFRYFPWAPGESTRNVEEAILWTLQSANQARRWKHTCGSLVN